MKLITGLGGRKYRTAPAVKLNSNRPQQVKTQPWWTMGFDVTAEPGMTSGKDHLTEPCGKNESKQEKSEHIDPHD